MECTKVNCPMQAGTITENCGYNCPWRTTAKLDDLISRAAAIEYLMTNMGWHDEDGYEVDDADEKRKVITDLVNGIHAVDAVPVIRCKDCMYWKSDMLTHFWKPCDVVSTDKDWYCPCGKRR